MRIATLLLAAGLGLTSADARADEADDGAVQEVAGTFSLIVSHGVV